MDVKANSDVKHAKSQLAAENKKKKTLEKSLTDVCISYFISYCEKRACSLIFPIKTLY